MDYYYSRHVISQPYRIQKDFQLSRRYVQQRDLELRRSRRVQQALDRETDLARLAAIQKLRAEQQYEEYILRRQQQQRQQEVEYSRERIIREQHLLEQSRFMQSERRSRALREEQADRQRIILLSEDKKRAQLLEASRKIELDAHLKIQDQITRENLRVKEEQLQQQKLQAELRTIDVEIGTIYDQRQARRRSQLLELQALDQKIFKVKQDLRASKIKQTALQDSLNNLSKIIVPGAR